MKLILNFNSETYGIVTVVAGIPTSMRSLDVELSWNQGSL
jgi:hypothetical protein